MGNKFLQFLAQHLTIKQFYLRTIVEANDILKIMHVLFQ